MAAGVVVNAGAGKDCPGKLSMFVLVFFLLMIFFFKKKIEVARKREKKTSLCLHLACCYVLANQGIF